MLDVDTSHRSGKYRFRQDGAAGFIFKCDAKGHASTTGSRWAVEIDGIDGNQTFDTKAEAEGYANKATRAGYGAYGEEPTIVNVLGLSYTAEYEGKASLDIRTTSGEFVRVALNARQRARLLQMLATDFADDVLYDNVTFKSEER